MELSTFATYVGLLRDFLILVVGLAVLVMAVALYGKISSVVQSVNRTVKAVEDTAASISSKAAGPMGAGLAVGVGKAVSMLWRLVRRRPRGGEDNEQ